MLGILHQVFDLQLMYMKENALGDSIRLLMQAEERVLRNLTIQAAAPPLGGNSVNQC